MMRREASFEGADDEEKEFCFVAHYILFYFI